MYRFACLLCLITTSAWADILPHKLFASGAIIQRDTPFIIKGTAVNETEVVVFIDDKQVGNAEVSDANDWRVTVPAYSAGGPHTITFKGNTQTQISDIYFGDVWLASGQSNMELTMARVKDDYPQDTRSADFPMIREFAVEDRYAFDGPQSDYQKGEWLTATPENIDRLSAVAFYFSRELHQTLDVPIGIVNAALGGSPIEAWMRESDLAPYPEALKQLSRFKQPEFVASTIASDQHRQGDWYQTLDTNDKGLSGHTKWYEPGVDDSQWQSFSVPGYLNTGNSKLFSGVWWLRKHIWLPAAPDQAARLHLGRIVDADEVFINGVKVGNTTYQYPPRRYNVPASVLRQGDNVIAVRITATGSESGFVPDKPYEIGNDQFQVSLEGEWQYKVGTTQPPLAPQTFVRWQPTGLYNAMIAPAGDFPVKGVLWYQGESNTKAPKGYDRKLLTMIQSWQTLWEKPLPFYVVQLANFMERKPAPSESRWATLRNLQAKAAKHENVELVVTIDLGDWNDIHPTNKRDVGRRLAHSALATTYGKRIDYEGPKAKALVRDKHRLKIQFEASNLPLKLRYAGHNGFSIAGSDGQFVWATPVIVGDDIVLSHPQIADPVAVRYAWADNPVAGLFNASGLPAAPFWLTVNDK